MPRNLQHLSTALAFSALLLSSRLQAQEPAEDLATTCDALIPPLLEKERVPAFALALMRDGKVVAERFYGRVGRKDATPPGPESAFGVASVSKMFTSWGVMRLVEQGKLALDDPVQPQLKRWKLPRSRYGEEQVTLRHLLTHTAGYDMSGKWHYRVDRPIPALIDSVSGKARSPLRPRLKHTPGSRFRYSGVNYALVQLLVEDTTGLPFMDYMRATVLRPLGLENTDYEFTEEIAARVVDSHDPRDRRVTHHRAIAPAAGSIHTTLRDLATFVATWFEGAQGEPAGREIISPASLALMTTSASEGGYGLGYQIQPVWPGLTVIGSSGGTRGWTCHVYAIKETGSAIIALTSSTDGGPVLDAVHQAWLKAECDATKAGWSPAKANAFTAQYNGRWRGAIEGAGDGTRTIPFTLTLATKDGVVSGTYRGDHWKKELPLLVFQLDSDGFRASIDELYGSYFTGRPLSKTELAGQYYENGSMTFRIKRVGD